MPPDKLKIQSWSIDIDDEEAEAKAIYISGPMTGVEDLAGLCIEASRIQALLVSRGIFVYNPYGSCLHESSWHVPKSRWLDNDFFWLHFCDAILMLDGWENSVGARAEYDFARAHNLAVYFADSGSPLPFNLDSQGDA